MTRSLTELGVPFLERVATNEGLRDWLGERSRHAHWRELSILCRVLGHSAELERVFAEQRHRYEFNSTRLQEIGEHEERLASFAREHAL